MNVTAKGFLRLTLLPGIVPRFRELFQSGFGHIALYMAMIYRTVGLIPAGHPYLDVDNLGKFGIRNVMGLAASNLKFDRRHADQVAIFFILVLGIVLLFAQFGLLMFALFTGSAEAAGIFTPPDPSQDLAFILMDRVFGVPGLFNSCVAQNAVCLGSVHPDGAFPYPYHRAMHSIFSFYSYGLLVVAVIIVSYLTLLVVVETAQTGTPFGQRFNHVWTPLRIVAGLGLLIPLSSGLNTAQYLTLYTAKMGSGLASNGWHLFVNKTTSQSPTLLGSGDVLLGRPKSPMVSQDLIQFYTVVAACADAYKKMYGVEVQPYLIRGIFSQDPAMSLRAHAQSTWAPGILYKELSEWSGGDLTIRFGVHDETLYKQERGYVSPICGEITMRTIAQGAPAVMSATVLAESDNGYGFDNNPIDMLLSDYIQTFVLDLWAESTEGWGSMNRIGTWGQNINSRYLPIDRIPDAELPTSENKNRVMAWYQTRLQDSVAMAHNDTATRYPWAEDSRVYGWAGAGIWYNKIAQVNGDFVAAMYNIPRPTLYPRVMERVQAEKSKQNKFDSAEQRFEPVLADGTPIDLGDAKEALIAQSLAHAFAVWEDSTLACENRADGRVLCGGRATETGNVILDVAYLMLGANGLWEMRENEHVHPLAQLASLGRSLVEHGTISLGVAAGSGLMKILGRKTIIGGFAGAVSGAALSIAMIGLGVGIVLFYVIPLMPFLYFFFAVGGWVMGIFEAMVGIPLWALAHLKIDGDGFPTRASMNGYYLLLEIFIRPILIVFGLIAAVAIFYALVRTLNNVFDLAVSNLTGFDKGAAATVASGNMGSVSFYRGIMDQLFFTVLYAIVVYMTGQACFKLIDKIPNSVLRWMSAGVSGFGRGLQPPADNLVRNALVGSNVALNSAGNLMGKGNVSGSDDSA